MEHHVEYLQHSLVSRGNTMAWLLPFGINALWAEDAIRIHLRQFAAVELFCSTFRNGRSDPEPDFESFPLLKREG